MRLSNCPKNRRIWDVERGPDVNVLDYIVGDYRWYIEMRKHNYSLNIAALKL